MSGPVPHTGGRAAAAAAKGVLRERLRDRRGINGIGLERRDEGYCLRVNVEDSGAAAGVPPEVDGVGVHVVVVGRVGLRGARD